MLIDEEKELLIFRYRENLLNAEERSKVEQMLDAEPELRELAELYDPDLLVPGYGNEVYPRKESLKKHGTNRKRLWLTISAAAASVAAVIIPVFLSIDRNNSDEHRLAVSKTPVANQYDIPAETTIETIPEASPLFAASHKKEPPTETKQPDNETTETEITETETNRIMITNDLIAFTDDINSIGDADVAEPHVVVTDKLITYLDSDEDAEPHIDAPEKSRSALACTMEDWKNEIQLASVEFRTNIINKVLK